MSGIAGGKTPESEIARRLERWIARAATELGWKAADRVRRQERMLASVAAGGARAEKLAVELERLAVKLEKSASAREARRLAGLVKIRASAETPADPRLLLRALVEALAPALAFESATAFVYEPDGRLLPVFAAGSHVDLIPDIHFDSGAGFSSWVAKTRRPVLLSAFREDPIGVPVERPASFLSVPLLVEDDLVAVLNFAHRRPGTFTVGDRDLVLLAGRIAAPALARPAQVPAWDPELTTRTA
jgi:transcriptional regulator with GAF, ATPase, and Fis domain